MNSDKPTFEAVPMFKAYPAVDPGHEDTISKPLPDEARIAKSRADWLGSSGAEPAARFMKTGGAAKPASAQPAYKLRQKLADLDLQLQHPHLDRKWRKKIASPRAEQIPVERGHGKPKVRKQQ
jgi:hypothetical protein